MPSEAELQRELLRADRARQQLASLQRNAEALSAVILDRERAIRSLRDLDTAAREEVLIPLGGGTFLAGRVAPGSRLLRSVGAGVVLERTASEALAELEREVEELQGQSQRLLEAAQSLQDEADDAEGRAQDILRELQGPGAARPPPPAAARGRKPPGPGTRGA